MYQYENALWAKNLQYVAGCDEVGRGPLAGPLVCAAVILNPKQPIEGLYDSKALSEKKRVQLYDHICEKALAYHIHFTDETTVDKKNVYRASREGMIAALQALQHPVDYVLSDAMPLHGLNIPYQSIIKGDQLSATIAAASILAKVARDRHMIDLAKTYPDYGFEKHKGYPTKAHLEAIKKHGVTDVHRKSFKPVKKALEVQMTLDV